MNSRENDVASSNMFYVGACHFSWYSLHSRIHQTAALCHTSLVKHAANELSLRIPLAKCKPDPSLHLLTGEIRSNEIKCWRYPPVVMVTQLGGEKLQLGEYVLYVCVLVMETCPVIGV